MSEPTRSSTANSRQWLLPIQGMHCAACAQRLQKVLQQQPQVLEAQVHFATAQAQLRIESGRGLNELLDVISSAGFEVPVNRVSLAIQGVHCASCVRRIEQGLLQVAGVVRISVNPSSGMAELVMLAQTEPGAILQALSALGFSAQWPDTEPPAATEGEARRWPEWGPVLLAAALTLPLLLPMVAMLWGGHLAWPPLWQWLLATPVQFGLGARFYRGAWQALRNGSGTMDLLVALGTSAAYGLSCWLWLGRLGAADGVVPPLYFEASATVITLVLLGRWLETRAKRQTMAALEALQALRPDLARVWRDGRWLSVPLARLVVGDRVQVLAGERIPVDGRVLQGESLVDESLLTGESLPVDKQPGATVIGGTLNGDGVLELLTERLGSQSTLAQIIQLVEQAQLVKPPVQRLVDRVSAVFVPVVVTVAFLTLLGWGLWGGQWQPAVLHAVAVLVIACPCALGLATPTAIMVGTGVAARHGILIRDVVALEQARAIGRVIFDKTGTLTQGQPALVSWLAVADAGERIRACFPGARESTLEPVLWLAAGVGQSSTHPLGQALHRAAGSLPLPTIERVVSLPGRGMQGALNGADGDWELSLGGERLLAELDVKLPDELALWQQQARANAQTVSFLLIRQASESWSLLAGFAFADPIKPESRAAVQQLQQAGIQVAMLSGDHLDVVSRVAGELGIQEYQASLLPQEKAAQVRRWQQAGQVQAMVGDGINDAPALAAAEVGIAMASGSDVAMQSASITLMRADPQLVLDAIRLSQQTYAKIRQNLFWAFIYNVLGIPLAAAGLLNPVVAGAAMAFSSVSVVSNALLLRRWQSARRPLESQARSQGEVQASIGSKQHE